MEERGVAEALLRLGVRVVVHAVLAGAERHGEEVARLLERVVEPGGVERLAQPGAQLLRAPVDGLVRDPVRELQGGEARGHGHGVPGQRARLVDGTRGRQVLHDLSASAECGSGQSPADDLAEREEVRGPVLAVLVAQSPVAGLVHTEAREDLVEDHQGAVVLRETPDLSVELVRRGDHAHVAGGGLGDDGGDLSRVLGEDGLEGGEVVVGHHERLGGRGGRDSGGTGQGEGGHPGTGLGEQGVHVAVVAAGELHHEVPPGVATGQAQGRHGGLRARGDHADLLQRCHAVHHELRELGLPAGRGTEAQPTLHGLVHGLGHHGVGVAQQGGTPRAHEIHVLPAVHVREVGALCCGDERRGAAHRVERAHGGVHSPGHHPTGAVEQFLRNTHEITSFLSPGAAPGDTVARQTHARRSCVYRPFSSRNHRASSVA